jgi:hypothetical protein
MQKIIQLKSIILESLGAKMVVKAKAIVFMMLMLNGLK